MSNIYFSCNIIVFDTYQLPSKPQLNNPNKQDISSKSQIINNNNNKKSQLILKDKNKQIINYDFFTENNINLYNPFMNRDIESFPVIRIFGTTKSGQKCCINIHDYFPYFYISITKENYFNYKNKDTLQAFAIALEKAYIEYKTEMNKSKYFKSEEPEKDNSQIIIRDQEQIIHNITLVYKTNIYGYYNKESPFLKVECYNPLDIKNLMYLLDQEKINNKRYQCFDAHISYCTHFFGDFNLFGMGTIKIKKFSVREIIQDKINDIDFRKKFTFFQKNIQWENPNNNICIEEDVTNEEIINFIQKNNDFMVWNKKYIELMKVDVKYNNFNKSSSSPIEIDCTKDDIIVENIEEEVNLENVTNENQVNKDENFMDLNKEVNISNLKMHITHCVSLIDLWKEEIKRRKKNNLSPLKFEKISDQGVFTLTEDSFIKKKEESEFLLRKNFKVEDIFLDLEDLNFLSLEDNNSNNSSIIEHNDIKDLIEKRLNYRNKYIEKYYGHSYEWYKAKYNKSLFQNIFETITEHINNEVDGDSEQTGIDEDTYEKEFKQIKEDYEFDLSCFEPERTLNEFSIPNNTRNLFKDILNNKTMEDLGMKTPSDKGDNNNDEFFLGETEIKNLFFSEQKEKDDKISKGKYLLIADSAMKKIIERNSSNKKKSQESNCDKEEDINALFYSDIDDYKRFYKNPKKLNPRFNAFKGNSMELMVNNFNKIIYKEKKNEFELIPSKMQIEEEKDNNKYNNEDMIKYDKIFFDKFYHKNINDKNDIINNSLLISNNKNSYNLIYEKYDIEISPITEKKFIPSYKINPKFISPKKEKDSDLDISEELSKLDGSAISALFGTETPIKEEGEKLSKLYEKYYEDNNNMTIISIEILADSISNLSFNYLTDPIICVFFSIYDDNYINNQKLSSKSSAKANKSNFYNFILTCLKDEKKLLCKRYNYSHQILRNDYFNNYSDNKDNNIEIFYAKDEIELLRKFIDCIKLYDPDIICGYEPESLSIGYIIKRGEFLGIPMFKLLNRLNNTRVNNLFSEEYIRKKVIPDNKRNSVNYDKAKEDPRFYEDYKKLKKFQMKFNNLVKIKGRIIIDVWRKICNEIKTNDYSLENVIFKALNIRESKIDYFTLKSMISAKQINKILFVLNYYLKRTKYNLLLLNKYDIVNRCTQFVKMYGIDFESNLTRGSQYKVEGVLSHLAKSKNVVLLSASKDQLIEQSPPRFTPMVMEPPKNIFYNPVIVLDFQSLYPSIMMAYNLCYSTCLGRLLKEDETDINSPLKKMGVTIYNKNLYTMLLKDFQQSKFYHKEKYISKNNQSNKEESEDFFNFVKDSCFLSPCRVLFVKKHIREGLIPIILKELLLTRIMIKKSMKLYDKNSDVYKFLHNRQLGIKGLANVIYGYTSAGFSGRMPNIEISDSILSMGRQMLRTAIDYIENKTPYELKVVYGDTDSVFISVKNKTKEEAIEIGKKLAEEITKLNPEPIKLQFEKVYCPLIFNAKKHYAGYKYEDKSSLDSVKNKKSAISLLDTKGLENVRRDSCDIVSKIVEKLLKILFDQKDLSKVKQYVFQCFDKIIKGRVILKDFIFSKEVKFGRYKGKILPPSAQVANYLHSKDPNFFAFYKQRVPYLVYNNPNGLKTLKDSVIYPYDFFENKSLTINSNYYITMIKKVLERFLGQLGVNIEEWYQTYKRPTNIGYNIYFYKTFNNKKNNYESHKKTNNEIEKKHMDSFDKRKQDIEDKKKFFAGSKITLKDETKRSDILNFFKPIESKNSNNIIANNSKSKDNEGNEIHKEILDLKFFEVDENGEIIEVEKEEENRKLQLIKYRERQMKYLEYIKKIKIFKKKQVEIRNICKFCSEFGNFNINDIEDIPCMNIQCKIFYEKLSVNNEIEQINDNLKEYKNLFSNYFE